MKELETEAFKKFEVDNIEYLKEARKFEMRQKILEKKLETSELIEEGIDIYSLPWIDDKSEN